MATIIGVDAHKTTHTLVAVSSAGVKLNQKTVAARSDGHRKALAWALKEHGPEIIWAVEDVRNVTYRLERDLMDAGQKVIRVPTWLMARVRGKGRSSPGKSDPIDALAVARAALREDNLPTARHDKVSRECKLLVDRRDRIKTIRSGAVNRFIWYAHELDPARTVRAYQLYASRNRQELAAWLEFLDGIVPRMAVAELADIGWLTDEARSIEVMLRAIVERAAPSLVDIPGCGFLTAAKILGETADVNRFRNEAAFARFAGVCPVPNWSGGTYGKMRPYFGGNRQLNAALHQIAMVQIRDGQAGRRYFDRRREEGDSVAKARRSLKRRLARVVYSRLRTEVRPI